MTAELKAPDGRAVAVIDFGSNSVRMVVAQVPGEGPVEVLERVRRPVHLGHDTFGTGRLSRSTMNGVMDVLRDYRRILDTYNVQFIRAVATSSVREAANADAFLDRVYTTIGMDVEVIEPAEESRLTISAVLDSLGDEAEIRRQDTLIAEVGGGTALLTILHEGEIAASESYRMGAIRLQEVLPTSHEPPKRAAEMLSHQIASVVSGISRFHSLGRIQCFLATGGDARFAARLVGKPEPGRPLHAVARKEMEGLINTCCGYSMEELSRKYSLPFSDAETIVPALLGYQALLKATKSPRMLVSPVSMRDGLLLDLARILRGQQDVRLHESVLASARSLGEKYVYDAAHAEHVANLSVKLFDALRPEHGLNNHHRLLLHVAGTLHEIGGFISNRSHHKHSYYLIINSVLYGLRKEDLAIVANVARYHRRSSPKPTHVEYMNLPRESRAIISKLASLLRVADALDRGHNQQVMDVQLERQDDELVMYVQGLADLALERQAMASKADVFEDAYGMTVRLEEAGGEPADKRRAEPIE